MSQKRRTPGYIIFYILFLPDTWQIVIGIIAAYFFTPVILPENMGKPGIALLYVMIVTIGYAASRAPARGLARLLKRWVLGDRLP